MTPTPTPTPEALLTSAAPGVGGGKHAAKNARKRANAAKKKAAVDGLQTFADAIAALASAGAGAGVWSDVKSRAVAAASGGGAAAWADAAASAKAVKKQKSPCAVPVMDLFASHVYPCGQLMEYTPLPGTNTARVGAEELRARERLSEEMYNEVREAAEVHRHVRLDLQKWLKPGLSMIDIAHRIENGTKTLLKASDRLKRGWGFPTGLSLNHVAAHYTPNYGDKTVLQKGDVLKVDIGTHVNGRIVDSAFTWTFDPKYDNLLAAVRAATEAGVAAAGIDVRLCDVGAAIQEVMESFEVTIDGKTYPVKVIRGLYGHSILPHRIHGGKSVPTVKNHDQTRMEEGEFFAIETFGSTGRGYTIEDGECSHYMRNYDDPHAMAVSPKSLRLPKARELLAHIDKHHSTLAFCRRWLDDEGMKGYLMGLKSLVDQDIVRPCFPLHDIKGCFTAQYEHTILLRPTCKEVISRGSDY